MTMFGRNMEWPVHFNCRVNIEPLASQGESMQLTDEQIAAAARACYNAQCHFNRPIGTAYPHDSWDNLPARHKESYRVGVTASAKHLQFLWASPNNEEMKKACERFASAGNKHCTWMGVPTNSMMLALSDFVLSRNANLIFNLVDPRRAKIADILQYVKEASKISPIDYREPTPDEIAVRILAELDAKE